MNNNESAAREIGTSSNLEPPINLNLSHLLLAWLTSLFVNNVDISFILLFEAIEKICTITVMSILVDLASIITTSSVKLWCIKKISCD